MHDEGLLFCFIILYFKKLEHVLEGTNKEAKYRKIRENQSITVVSAIITSKYTACQCSQRCGYNVVYLYSFINTLKDIPSNDKNDNI